jgi:sec-independent protein translocase protein TatA
MQFGPGELLIVLVIVLILFGAGKLPQVFSSLGKGVREFREAAEGKEATTTGEAGPAPRAASPTQQTPPDTVATGSVTSGTPHTVSASPSPPSTSSSTPPEVKRG